MDISQAGRARRFPYRARGRRRAAELPFPIVAIGASAGGLAALEKVIGGIAPDSGAAHVVIQHLSPDFESHMAGLLARVTSMPVLQPKDGTELAPDHVYVLPPKKEMILSGGKLLLTDKDPRNAPSLPIDTFLRSLSQEAGARAVAVILSGTGSDGARGIRAVKAAGGHVIVQDPADAEFDGMPHTAIATGVADFVATANDIPAEVGRVIKAPATSADGWPALDERRRHHARSSKRWPSTTTSTSLLQGHDARSPHHAAHRLDGRRQRRRLRGADRGRPRRAQTHVSGSADRRDGVLPRSRKLRRSSRTRSRSSLFNEGPRELRIWVAGAPRAKRFTPSRSCSTSCARAQLERAQFGCSRRTCSTRR